MCIVTDRILETLVVDNRDEWGRNDETKRSRLLIENFDLANNLTPIGYDLRVGAKFFRMSTKNTEFETLSPEGILTIRPGELMAIETLEYVGMPQSKQYSGLIVSKVSIVNRGLSHISTSLDPDYQGHLIITVGNMTGRDVELSHGAALCTMILMRNEEPASRDCGKTPGGHLNAIQMHWKPEKIWQRTRIRRLLLKSLIAALPLVALAIRWVTASDLSTAEVALWVAIVPLLSASASELWRF